MFYGDNAGQIATRAKDITTRLEVIEDAERFYQWLTAQADADLLEPGLPSGFTQPQLDRLRATFTDMHALWLLVHDQPMPASYSITGSHDFLANARHIIGP